MKFYDYELAKTIIQTFIDLDVLDSASLGINEDWFWTAETIYEEGKWEKELCSNTELEYAYKNKENPFLDEGHPNLSKLTGGLGGSVWGIPVLQVQFKDGSDKTFECYYSKGEELSSEQYSERIGNYVQGLGEISGPQFEERMKLNIEKFTKTEENSK